MVPTRCEFHGMLLAMVLGLLSAGCSTERDLPGPAAVPLTRYSVSRPHELPPRLTIPLRRHGEHLMVRARLNGKDAGWFLFDMGSSVTGIESGLGRRLELATTGQRTVVGIGGREQVDIRRAESLSIGDLEIVSGELLAPKLLRLSRSLGTPLSGVVGFPALQRLPFTIDYRNLSVTFYGPDQFREPAGAARQRLLVHRGLPLVSARLADRHLVWLILDTGADNEVTLPHSVLRRRPNIVSVPFSGPGASVGIGGQVSSIQTWLKSLWMFGLDLHNVPVSFDQPPESMDPCRMVIGRLGNKLLQHFRLTIDARRRWVWAEWHPQN